MSKKKRKQGIVNHLGIEILHRVDGIIMPSLNILIVYGGVSENSLFRMGIPVSSRVMQNWWIF